MISLCLFDVFEVHDDTRSELCLVGALESGERCAVLLHHCRYPIYLAVAPNWSGRATLREDLEDYIMQRNKSGYWCNRSLCQCTLCECGFHRQACRCAVCHDCGKVVCVCRGQVEINYELCGKRRRRISQAEDCVLSIEQVDRLGAMGYEPEPRCFLQITLSRALYVRDARKYLETIAHETGVSRLQQGVYDCLVNATDSFLAQVNTGGFAWVDIEGAEPVVAPATRCQLEYRADFRSVRFAGRDRPVPPLRIMTLDIETLKRGPSWGPTDPIIMIPLQYGAKKVLLYWGDPIDGLPGDWVPLHFDSEWAMLQGFCHCVRHQDPDVLEGHNILKFDIPHILRRCLALDIKADITRVLDHETRLLDTLMQVGGSGLLKTVIVSCPGRFVMDTLVFARKNLSLDNNSLGKVAESLNLSVAKDDVDYEDIRPLFEGTHPHYSPADGRRRLGTYACHDVDVCRAISETSGAITGTVTAAFARKVLARHWLERTAMFFYRRLLYWKKWGRYLLPAYGHDEQSPLFDNEPRILALLSKQEKFEGGAVSSPVAKLYRQPVGVVDFASMYPSIMRKYNICNTTFLGSNPARHGIPEEQRYRARTGFWYAKSSLRVGLLPEILTELGLLRAEAKRQMANCEPGTPQYVYYNRLQEAFKVAGNSCYGVLGTTVDDTSNPANAETVTMIGRDLKAAVERHIEAVFPGTEVIYGDTDSCMILLKHLPAVNTWEAADLARQLLAEIVENLNTRSNLYEKPMQIEGENIYWFGYLIAAAKTYGGRFISAKVGDRSAPKLKLRGYQCVRRDNAPFASAAQREILTMILMDAAEPFEVEFRAKEHVAAILNLRQAPSVFPPPKGYEWPFGRDIPLSALTYSINLTRDLQLFAQDEPHVFAGKQLVAAGHTIEPGDHIQYVMVTHPGKAVAPGARPVALFREGVDAVDIAHYFKHLQSLLQRVLVSVLHEATLHDLFRVQNYKHLAAMKPVGAGSILSYMRVAADATYVQAAALRKPGKTKQMRQSKLPW